MYIRFNNGDFLLFIIIYNILSMRTKAENDRLKVFRGTVFRTITYFCIYIQFLTIRSNDKNNSL